MNIFQDFTLTWWQGGIFKWGMFMLGIAVGAYWSAVFIPYLLCLLIMVVLLLTYITYEWFKQINAKP